jgi:hypothetical protein
MADDITSEVNTEEKLVEELTEQRHKQTVEHTLEKNPLMTVAAGLNEQLIEMTKRGVNSALFQGVERCIRVLDKGSNSQRHCMAMMVSDNVHGKHCTSCQKSPNPGCPKPTVINSSMIRLNDKELKECGLDKDPTYVPPEKRGGIIETKPVRVKEESKAKRLYTRREKVAVPNVVKIEVSMKDLSECNVNDIATLLLEKAIGAIYELPVAKFSDAEAIRIVSDKVKEVLKGK